MKAKKRPVSQAERAFFHVSACLQLQMPMIGNGRCACTRSGISRHLIHAESCQCSSGTERPPHQTSQVMDAEPGLVGVEEVVVAGKKQWG